MIKLSESTILLVVVIIAAIAGLFTLIGLTTPRWLKVGVGLWNCNRVCSSSAAVLSILALCLVVISTILFILMLIGLFSRRFRLLPFSLLIIATFCLLITTTSYLRHTQIIGFSFELMVTAHGLTLLASLILAVWYGTTLDESSINGGSAR
jgi:hypothetical protein